MAHTIEFVILGWPLFQMPLPLVAVLSATTELVISDAEWLATFIDRLEHAGRFGEHIGGIGTYNSNAHHGPFVHVDARGYRARW